MGLRIHVYLTDEQIIQEIKKQQTNKHASTYIESCIKFYKENNDIVQRYTRLIENTSIKTQKK